MGKKKLRVKEIPPPMPCHASKSHTPVPVGSIFPVNSATRALMRATLDSIATPSQQMYSVKPNGKHALSSPLVSPSASSSSVRVAFPGRDRSST